MKTFEFRDFIVIRSFYSGKVFLYNIATWIYIAFEFGKKKTFDSEVAARIKVKSCHFRMSPWLKYLRAIFTCVRALIGMTSQRGPDT